jgi:hypothetical protein
MLNNNIAVSRNSQSIDRRFDARCCFHLGFQASVTAYPSYDKHERYDPAGKFRAQAELAQRGLDEVLAARACKDEPAE